MLKPSNNIDKELKKVQDKGITNSKNKIIVIVVVIAVTVFLGTTYALFSSDGVLTAYSSKVNKKVTVTVNSTNGTVNSLSGTVLKDNEIKTSPNFSSTSDQGLYVQKDDTTKSINGKPTYYFRGNVTNNYVTFAGMTWRIVRINEDGTIRLISALEYDGGAYSGSANGAYESSSIKTKIDNWYNNLSTANQSLIATGVFCNDTTLTAASRLSSSPTFVCPTNAKTLNLKAGIISADELRYSGSAINANGNTFINNGWTWTMTMASSTRMYYIRDAGVWNDADGTITSKYRNYRYIINLNSDVTVTSGDGTSSNPFVVASNSLTSVSNTADYKVTQYFSAIPNSGYEYESLSCTNSQSASYDKATGKLIITPTKDTTCTVKFKKKTVSSILLASNTIITSTPDFSKGEPPASGTNTGSGLYKTADDYGTSYYFRGAIDNNYVSFAGMIWRIVRINGDGTIRLILNQNAGNSAFSSINKEANGVGYTYDNASACTKSSPCISSFNSSSSTFSNNKTVTNSTIKSTLENWYKNNLASYDSKIALGSYCNDTTNTTNGGPIVFGPYNRLSSAKPSLLCDDTSVLYGGYYKLKVGLMTVDEAIYAGLSKEVASDRTNYLYYKNNDYYSWYTMSPSNFNVYNSFMYIIDGMRFNVDTHIRNNISVTSVEFSTRPVINLNSNVYITGGDGTSSNPYTIG